MKDISLECIIFLCKTYLYSALAVAIFALLYVLSWNDPVVVHIDPVQTYYIVSSTNYQSDNTDVCEDNMGYVQDEEYSDSLEYLACCVEAEAGDQSELGKRLVCDTVLNRFDLGEYSSLYDVIDEENQYSVVSDGRIMEAIPTEDTYRIVAEEINSRTNTEVLYFRTDHYHNFGIPLFKEDDHYFSK